MELFSLITNQPCYSKGHDNRQTQALKALQLLAPEAVLPSPACYVAACSRAVIPPEELNKLGLPVVWGRVCFPKGDKKIMAPSFKIFF